MYATVPDLLRLLAVPAFAYGAYRDIETRRVPDLLWPPLLVLGVVCLAIEGWNALHAPDAFAFRTFALRTVVSIVVVGGLGAFFYVVPVGFGGADAKALVAISVLLPTYPTYYFDGFVLPHVPTTIRVFALTVLTNALILGMAYPCYLLCSNAVHGHLSPVMAVGKRVPVDRLPTEHGSLLEDREGTHFTGGLDLDALRMYCRWRGVTLADLRDEPELRDPATLPETPSEPTDGAVTRDGTRADGGDRGEASDAGAGDGIDRGTDDATHPGDYDDPWGAAAFLGDIEGSAYGTSPATLREGLDVVTERDAVWITPGTPFFVTLCLGLVVALTYGDILFAVLRALGLV